MNIRNISSKILQYGCKILEQIIFWNIKILLSYKTTVGLTRVGTKGLITKGLEQKMTKGISDKRPKLTK